MIGARHIDMIAYHPSANEIIRRFHRQLKTFLTAWGERERWLDNMPYVRLGIRSTFKYELNGTPAECVHGTTLRLPGEFISAPTRSRSPAP